MKTKILALSALAVFAAPAFAQADPAPDPDVVEEAAAQATANVDAAEAPAAKPSTQIVSRGADGLPDVVSIDGQTYKVCKGDVQDSCINPRTAGLKFGARDLQYWPGRPASEIATPLPATPPANLPVEEEEAAGG